MSSGRKSIMKGIIADAADTGPAVSQPLRTPKPHAVGGAISDMLGAFETMTRGATQAASGLVLVDLDPATLDPSPYLDRMASPDDAENDITLADRIKEEGQLVPVMVRPHPQDPHRYQIAFGHRRVRACRLINRTVRAIIRDMSDTDLAIAQARENLERMDLTFLETARFALNLEQAGQSRSAIQTILAVDKADVSRMIKAAMSIPDDIANALGRLPGIGRPRIYDLAEALDQNPILAERIRAELAVRPLMKLEPAQRYARIMRLTHAQGASSASAPTRPLYAAGAHFGHAKATKKGIQFEITNPECARFVEAQLPRLLEEFAAGVSR